MLLGRLGPSDHPLWSSLVWRNELADMFVDVAEVIGDVIEHGAHNEPTDLMALYERWRAQGDPRDAKLLVRAGVLLDTEGSDIEQ